jgi:hypothetical protein
MPNEKTNSASGRRIYIAAAATVILFFGTALATRGGARAGLITGSCPEQPLSQPFVPWLDGAKYALVGDGGFESGGAGWTLKGGAAVVDGNEPWYVRAVGDSRLLNLPAGARATSPAACIGLLHPTARFFVRSLGGSLKVDATVTVLGLPLTIPVGVVVAGDSFAPTLPLALLTNLTVPLTGGRASLALTFTAVGGAVQIDDLYIDPFKVN